MIFDFKIILNISEMYFQYNFYYYEIQMVFLINL